MTVEYIDGRMRTFLSEELEIENGKIVPEARLKEDLGIDSLEVVDVVVLIEKEFGFKMKLEDFKTLRTYGEFCTFIHQKSA